MFGTLNAVLAADELPPVVQANFAYPLQDYTTLSTLSSMPTGGLITRSGNAMLYDSTGNLTYAPNNQYINSASATNTARTITTVAGINYYIWIQTSTGTATIVASGTNTTTFNGSTGGTFTAFTATSGTLTLTPTSNYANITQVVVAQITYETALRSVDNVVTTSAAYYGPRFDYYYNGSSWVNKGLLIEGTRTNLLTYSNTFSNAAWTKARASITANAITAPDGTTAGSKLVEDTSSASHTVFQTYSSPSVSTTYTSTAYFKAAERTQCMIELYDGTNDGKVYFNLSTGAYISSSGPVSTYSISNVGNGWYRVSITMPTSSTATFLTTYLYPAVSGSVTYTGDGSSGIYVYGAQLETASFPSSYIPTTTASVARAVESFSITGYSTNLINAYYTDEATGNAYSLPYNAGVNPSPSFAWLTSLNPYTNAYAGSITSPSWLSFSRTGNAMMYASTGKLTWAPANLILNSATFATQNVTTNAQNYILSFTAVGTGTITLSGTSTAGPLTGTNARVSLLITPTAGTLTLTLSTASGTVTNAQLEPVTYQTSPSLYNATTSSAYFGPRYDYNPSTTPATARGLLIEESRVNILLYSSNLGGGQYNGVNGTAAFSQIAGPDGVINMATITATAAGSRINPSSATTVTASTTYTLSAYVKSYPSRYAGMFLSTINVGAIYDLTGNGAVVSSAGSPIATSIQYVGNGIYRISITGNSGANTTIGMGVGVSDGSTYTSSFYPSATSGTIATGYWQLEAGAFATSYIPTTGASVTRAADIAQLTGTALTVAGAATGSAIVQTTLWENSTASARDLLSSSTTRRLLYSNSSNTVLSSTDGTTSLNSTIGGSGTFTGGAVRSAIGWASNGRSLVANNGTLTSDSVNLSTGATITLGGYGSTTTFDGWIASLALYNTRLPDTILKAKSVVNVPY